MSVVVTISNHTNLKKAKDLLGAKDENETVELALEIAIQKLEAFKIAIQKLETKQLVSDLPDDFFGDLLTEETNLSDGESIRAVIEERKNKIIEEFELKKEAVEINNVFDLNYVKAKRTYEIEAEFKFVGRGKPLPFDFSEVNFDDEE